MSEWLMILVMAFSGALFAAGGTHIKGIGGQKWIRRFGIPVFLFVITRALDVYLFGSIAMALTLCIALHMGYGERTPYWRKALVFAGYGLPFLFIGWSWWIVIMPIVCLVMFRLSNWKPMATTFYWKCVEFLYGTLIAVTLIGAIK